jgi:hypothetical protein
MKLSDIELESATSEEEKESFYEVLVKSYKLKL